VLQARPSALPAVSSDRLAARIQITVIRSGVTSTERETILAPCYVLLSYPRNLDSGDGFEPLQGGYCLERTHNGFQDRCIMYYSFIFA
jgi:hypothetical protein